MSVQGVCDAVGVQCSGGAVQWVCKGSATHWGRGPIGVKRCSVGHGGVRSVCGVGGPHVGRVDLWGVGTYGV